MTDEARQSAICVFAGAIVGLLFGVSLAEPKVIAELKTLPAASAQEALAGHAGIAAKSLEDAMRPGASWGLPPEEFQSTASVVLHTVPQQEIGKHCQFANACAVTGGAIGAVVMPDPCEYIETRAEVYAATLCHEIGHIAGWSHGSIGLAGRP
jgi:hypothetical protein